MDRIIQDEEYHTIVSSILSKNEFSKEMRQIKHHDSNRLNHLLKVSYYAYRRAKDLRLDYEQVARAGLLHDFYLDSVYNQETFREKVLLYTMKHPQAAVKNAKKLVKKKKILFVHTCFH